MAFIQADADAFEEAIRRRIRTGDSQVINYSDGRRWEGSDLGEMFEQLAMINRSIAISGGNGRPRIKQVRLVSGGGG